MLPVVGVLGITGNLVVVAVYRCEDDISSPSCMTPCHCYPGGATP